MRILAAFFTILFTFINPVMILKVVSEVERIVGDTEDKESAKNRTELQLKLIQLAADFVSSNQLAARVKTVVTVSVLSMTLIHIALTCMCLYGIYSCRPALVRPLIFDICFSFFFLLTFVILSLCMYWKLNTNGDMNDNGLVKHHLRVSRNLYVSAAFLFIYAFWLIVNISGYRDTKKMHADFMYWIVEERMSMRSHGHNVSADNRSDRSSKGSKASRTSKGSSRSVRSEHWAHSRPNSVTASVGSKRASIVNARLSVPL